MTRSNARWVFEVLRAVRLRCAATAQQLADWSREAVPELAWPPEVRDAEREAEAAVEADPGHAFARLSRRFDLSRDEQRQLWVLVGAELCPIVRHQLRELASDQLADPTTDVLRRVVYGLGVGSEAWMELGARGTLRHFGLVERTDGAGDIPEHRQTWKVSRRVLALVHGHDHLDESVADLARVDAPPAHELVLPPGLAADLSGAIARETLVLVQGASGSGKRSALLATLAAAGRRGLTIEGRLLARETAVFRAQLRALARECRLFELVPLIRDLDALVTVEGEQDRIAILEAELGGLVLATSTRPIGRRWSRPPVLLEVRPLDRDARARLWGRAIPAAAEGDAELLATMYPMAVWASEMTSRLMKLSWPALAAPPGTQAQPAAARAAIAKMKAVGDAAAATTEFAAASQQDSTVRHWVRYVEESSARTTPLHPASEELVDGLLDVMFDGSQVVPTAPIRFTGARVLGVRKAVVRRIATRPLRELGLAVRAIGAVNPAYKVIVYRSAGGAIDLRDESSGKPEHGARGEWFARRSGVTGRVRETDQLAGARRFIDSEIMPLSLILIAPWLGSLENDSAE